MTLAEINQRVADGPRDEFGWRDRFVRLNAALLPHLSALVKQWLPEGRAVGSEWLALNPRRHDRRLGSFRINVCTGRWADFATGECGGDPVSLYAYLFTDGRQGVAARALESGAVSVRPRWSAKLAEAVYPGPDAAKRVAKARSIYEAAAPICGPAKTYLVSRGLRPSPAWKPLREALLHYPHQGRYPALVAPVTGYDGAIDGIQRTFLTAQGRKLAVADPKLSLGNIRGGAIRLGIPADAVTICEGLEDGLSLLQLGAPVVWVAAGAGMMPHMKLPDTVRHVVIAADADLAGERAAQVAAKTFSSQGRTVRIVLPIAPAKDFNAEVQEAANGR